MTKTILIVDDAKTIRHLTRFALAKGGFNILEAEDGKQGLEILEKSTIDLVISDLNMPNMDGLEMCRAMRNSEKLKDIPVFMLTTETQHEFTIHGQETGIKAWIVKPFVPEKLLAAVQRIVR
jgi:two-component system, chemotaxis family, chemotaxis protein CheY